VEVFSIQGKKVLTVSNDGDELVSLDLGNLHKGMYFVLAQGEAGEKRVFKVMK
jgi:hypothetical protein